MRSAKCVDSDNNEKADSYCEALTPPLLKQTCQMDECPKWEVGQWNTVSLHELNQISRKKSLSVFVL
jgi:hypothetical protein